MHDSLTITSTLSGGTAKEHMPHASPTLPVTTGVGTVEDHTPSPPEDAAPCISSSSGGGGGGGGGTITTRAFCFMAIGGSIGAGLFVASGAAVQKGGPASVVAAFVVLGLAVWLAMCALGELAACVPARGSFYGYSLRFVGESWGFAMGWNYVLNFVLIVAFEMTVVVMLAQYWRPGLSIRESGLFLVVLGLLPLLALHLLLGGKGYSEAETGFSVVKVGVLAMFMVVAIVIATGGTPDAGGRGFENYLNGNAVRNGFPGFLSVFVAAGMAYGGTEMLGLSVAECQHPRRVMPLGSMVVVGRILFCYVLSLFFVGLVVKPSDFDRPEFAGLHVVSPFVVAVRVAGLPGLATFINVALILAVLSMANASVFASSRAMSAICREGMGPALLGQDARVRWGIGRLKVDVNVPRNALITVGIIGNMAWIVAYSRGTLIFDWLLSLASLSNYFTWISICVCHIRFRNVVRQEGYEPKDLSWKSPFGVYGSYVSIIITVLCMITQVASAALPPVIGTDMSRIELLFMGLLGFIVVGGLFFGHLIYVSCKGGKTWRERLWIPLQDITLPELEASRSIPSVVPAEKNDDRIEGA